MNQHLQKIHDFLRQAESLSADERATLAKAVKNADTELTITEFKLERTEKVKRTTAILLEETIEELEQKRKAVEDKNRGLEVEAALERVRTRAMAMQRSDELAETASVLFQQIKDLGFETWSCGFCIWQKNDLSEVWMAADSGGLLPPMLIPFKKESTHRNIYEALLRGETQHEKIWEGNPLAEHYAFLRTIPSVKEAIEILENSGLTLPAKQCYYVGFFNQGYLLLITKEPAHGAGDLSKRFASVFEQTYTRFLDLQKAEAQAREAQIEAALERVRSKGIAMQKSDDLAYAVAIIFDELDKLNLGMLRCGIGILDKEKCSANVWTTTKSEGETVVQVSGDEPMNIHPLLQHAFDAWVKQDEDCNYVLQGDDLNNFYNALAGTNFRLPASQSIITNKADYKQYYYVATFQSGNLYAFRETEFTAEAKSIIKRFANVFDFTYTRFNDLKQAEQRLREAVKQASLDRVRGEIASMRTTNDLQKITPLIWNELTILGIPFIRCGVFIIDEQEQLIHSYLSTPDGKALAVFNLQFDAEGIGRDVLPAWCKKQIATIHWSEQEFAAYTKTLVDQGAVMSGERYVTEHPNTSLDLHFLPFLQGMLYVGNTGPLTSDDINLVQALAGAFSTAYARYEDFNRLELAKQQVENTLADLKAAQTQLIQSEKMASLGELTAGIAHEIQNPLNFVNNFSEVNREMLDELAEELKAGNIEEALAIANDIKQNEEKITHHGKRADGIVKGMLQHSRTGGGEKQPTNINALADEFMRLSYHGLRAKDKTFNAETIMYLDESLPMVNVIGQDVGRVLLNLFNNAFYAVNQKQKTADKNYKPEVSVTTSTNTGQVIIKVADNGMGIPSHVKEKIMQPFFTTKPTGEGTGLGLSLSYDIIVKGHGGDLRVNSIEGEGSEFIVSFPS